MRKPKFIYSGEIHYFRIPKAKWRDRLLKARKAGLNTVSSYIPWSWHEPHKGMFDFTGRTDPQRDLLTFINITKKMGLFFVARIGPVCNGEMIDEGLPRWLLQENPQIYLKGKELAGLPHVTLLSYLNPTYLDYIRKWYNEVLPIIKSNQISAGGNIILLQLDNEIGMIHWLNKAADYNTDTTGLYREWLGNKYKDIAHLNDMYGTKYTGFAEIKQPDGDADAENFLILNDWALFYRWYHAKYYTYLAELAREAKIEIPLLANIPHFYDFDVRGRGVYSPMTTCMFGDFSRFVPDVRFGGAYQMRRLDYENFHDIPVTTEVVRMITSPGVPVFCAELQTGKLNDRPRIYPADVELNLKTSAMHGIDGLNCYMFCGGTNPEPLGASGKYHEWQAPVSSSGDIRTHFQPIELFGRFIKTFGDNLADTQKVTDTAIGFYTPYYATEYFKGEFIEDHLELYRDRFFYDGIARMLILAGINYHFADIRRCSLNELLCHKTLWVFSMNFMDTETQAKLADYVDSGGKLIIYPAIPQTDLDRRNKSTVLMDKIGLKIIDTVKPPIVSINGADIAVEEKVTIMECAGADTIARTKKDGRACALLKHYGKGKILVIGFATPHLFDYHIRMVKDFARMMDITPSISVYPVRADKLPGSNGVDPDDIHVVMRKNGTSGFLLVANYHDEQRRCTLKLCLPGENKKSLLPSKGTILLDNRTAFILPLNVRISPEVVIKYSTAEVLGYVVGPSTSLPSTSLRTGRTGRAGMKTVLDVIGARDGEAEIVLSMKKPAKVSVDNKKIKFGYSVGVGLPALLTLRFSTTGHPQKVSIM